MFGGKGTFSTSPCTSCSLLAEPLRKCVRDASQERCTHTVAYRRSVRCLRISNSTASNSTAYTFATFSNKCTVRFPLPGPTSKTASCGCRSAACTMRRATDGSLSRCWPSRFRSRTRAVDKARCPLQAAVRSTVAGKHGNWPSKPGDLQPRRNSDAAMLLGVSQINLSCGFRQVLRVVFWRTWAAHIYTSRLQIAASSNRFTPPLTFSTGAAHGEA